MSPVAVVTGAGRGQGAAEAALLRLRGWDVVTSDVDGEVDVIADVGDATAWATLVDGVLGRFGRLDGLVNNAAGSSQFRALLDERADEVERVWRVNTLGPLLGIQAVAPAMRERGSGSIVNVSSYAGARGLPGHTAYGAAKWALRGISRTFAMLQSWVRSGSQGQRGAARTDRSTPALGPRAGRGRPASAIYRSAAPGRRQRWPRSSANLLSRLPPRPVSGAEVARGWWDRA